MTLLMCLSPISSLSLLPLIINNFLLVKKRVKGPCYFYFIFREKEHVSGGWDRGKERERMRERQRERETEREPQAGSMLRAEPNAGLTPWDHDLRQN